MFKRNLVYIPNNLNLDNMLVRYEPQFNYNIDFFKYVISKITLENLLKKKKTEKKKGFVNLNAAILSNYNKPYRKHLDYLITHGIIIENSTYSKVKNTSKSFKLAEKYLTSPVVNIINDKKINNQINNRKVEENITDIDYLEKWFNTELKIDKKNAKAEIKRLYNVDISNTNNSKIKIERAKLKRYTMKIALKKLIDGDFYHHKDNTTGRYHTNLTGIKKELRLFIRYDNKQLVEIDIINCQPFLSLALLDKHLYSINNMTNRIMQYNNNFDLEKYTTEILDISTYSMSINDYKNDVLNDKLYTNLANEYNKIYKKNHTRKDGKIGFYNAVFDNFDELNRRPYMQIFKQLYPDVYTAFSLIKKSSYRTLACILQNLEADLILNNVCKSIDNYNNTIPIFTIHDCIITTKENQLLVENTLKDTFKNKFGLVVNIKNTDYL